MKKKPVVLTCLLMGLLILSLTLTAGCDQTETETETETAAKAYQPGIINGNSYESAYLNLKITAPEGYAISSESDTEMKITQKDGPISLLMTANKNIHSSEDEFLNGLKEQYATDTSTVKTTVQGPITDRIIAGQTYRQLSLTSETMGIEILQYYVVKISGDRLVSMIVTFNADTEAETEKLMVQFQAID